MEQITLPNFLIIGAAKSGTTAIYEQLKLHPEVFMSNIKEPNYFAIKDGNLFFKKDTVPESYYKTLIKNFEDYKSLFKNATNYKAIGEASPLYLYDLNAAKEIKKVLPTVKLIVILRNPIERAFSNFAMHHAGLGLETTRDFITAINLEKNRMKEGWWWGFYYKDAGFYSAQLKRYYDQFNKEQILIILYDDLKNNPHKVFSDITTFLGIKPFNFDYTKRYKVTKVTKYKILEKVFYFKYLRPILRVIIPKSNRDKIKILIREFNSKTIQISKKEYDYLAPYYKDEIHKLEKMLNRDLKEWLTYNKSKK